MEESNVLADYNYSEGVFGTPCNRCHAVGRSSTPTREIICIVLAITCRLAGCIGNPI